MQGPGLASDDNEMNVSVADRPTRGRAKARWKFELLDELDDARLKIRDNGTRQRITPDKNEMKPRRLSQGSRLKKVGLAK